MLIQRLLVAIILIPLIILVIWLGGWPLTIVLAGALCIAAWEYWQLFRHGGYRPPLLVLVLGVLALVLARQVFELKNSDLILSAAVLVAMGAQVIGYEKGSKTAALDFNISLGGILYIGWLGAYFISLRNLPNGQWWLILVAAAIWLTDGMAFFVGRGLGKHKMSPRVSPKKTWEGYIGGIVFGSLGTMFLAFLLSLIVPDITALEGLVLGLVISVATPLGDLGESMLKREFGIKDSSNVIPGHGGMLDRFDSWLWAAALSFYLVMWFFV